MSRIVTYDFTGKAPAQGGGDYVVPGRYRVRVAEFEDGKASTGRRMQKVSLEIIGPAGSSEIGKRVSDNFVLEGDSDYGYRRFMAFLLALGFGVTAKSLRLDIDLIPGRGCEVVIVDEEMKATEQYEARTRSKVSTYHALDTGTSSAAASVVAPAAQPAPTPTPAPVVAPAPAPVATVDNGLDDLLQIASSVDELVQ